MRFGDKALSKVRSGRESGAHDMTNTFSTNGWRSRFAQTHNQPVVIADCA